MPEPRSLDDLQLRRPCSRRWEELHPVAGDGAKRFCTECSLHVHDLSSMPPEEALGLVIREEGKLCVRYERTPDGKFVSPAPPVTRWRRGLLAVGRAASVMLAAVGLLPACAESGEAGSPEGAEPVVPDLAGSAGTDTDEADGQESIEVIGGDAQMPQELLDELIYLGYCGD